MKQLMKIYEAMIQSPVIYHGTSGKFPPSKIDKNKYRVGLFGTTSPEVAAVFGKLIYSFKVKFNNPYIVDAENSRYDNIDTPPDMKQWTDLDSIDTDIIADYANEHGYDGVIIKNLLEGSGTSTISDIYIIFEAQSISSPKLYGKSQKRVLGGVYIWGVERV